MAIGDRTASVSESVQSRCAAPAISPPLAHSSDKHPAPAPLPFWGWNCLIAALCILQFSNTLHGDLLFDDGVAIIQNKNAHWDSDWKGVFTQDLWGRNMFEPGSHLSYRPLTTISFRFNHYFHELRPFGYHVVNIALHAAVTVLFTTAANRMLCSARTAVLAGVLFAVHPLHVEVATNIIGRAESLAAFFFLVALILFLPAAAAPKPCWARVFAAWLCISVGVFCKEQCVTVVGVCAVWEVVRLLQEWRKDEEEAAAAESGKKEGYRAGSAQDALHEADDAASPAPTFTPRMPLLVTCALLRWCCFTLLTLSLIFFRLRFNDHKPASFAPEENPARLVDEWQTRALTWSYLVPVNAFMLVVPHPLLCDWGHDTIPLIKSISDYRNIVTFSFFVSFALMTYFMLRSVLLTRARTPAVFIGVCWAAITFLPASNLFFPVGFVVADRVLYTPSMGGCILLAHAASVSYLKRQTLRPKLLVLLHSLLLLLLALLPVAYFVRTWIRNIDWHNGVNLWTSALRVNSGNPKFWLGLAHAKGEEGTQGLQEGIDFLYTAVALRGTYVEAYYNLGTSAYQVGRYVEAKQALSTAILLVPEHAGAYSNLGSALYSLREYAAAVDVFERLLEFQPDNLGHYTNLGSSLVMVEDFVEAERVYMHVVQNKPLDPSAYLNLGLCRAKAKDLNGAEAAFLHALELAPDDDSALFNLAVLYANHGMEDEVRSTLQQLLQVNPGHAGARAMLSRFPF